MRIQSVLRLVGQLTMIYAAVLLLPFFYSLVEGRPYWSFLASAAIGFAIAGGLYYYGKKSDFFSLRDGFLVVALTWWVTCLLGAIPFLGSGILSSPFDALFESVSGITATGASTISNVDAVPKAFILWRSIMHWLGGMGIIVLVLAFLKNLGADSAHFFKAEASAPRPGAVLPRIRNMASELWGLYLGFTIVCFLALYFLGALSAFEAINITFSTISTGGFLPTSSGYFSYQGNYVVMAVTAFFMVLGGGNFALYYGISKKGLREISNDLEFKTYLVIILIGGGLVAASLYYQYGHPLTSIADGFFMYISMQTGSGFAIGDYSQWPSFAQMILFISTFIGGCSGSTTGAIKVFRFIVMFKSIGIYLRQSIHPRQVQVFRINGHVVRPVIVQGIWHFFFLYMATFAISTILLSLTGLTYLEALTCVSATLGNVGLAFGSLGPTASFDVLSPLAKLICVVDMVLGRLEMFTVFVVLNTEFWKGYFVKVKK